MKKTISLLAVTIITAAILLFTNCPVASSGSSGGGGSSGGTTTDTSAKAITAFGFTSAKNSVLSTDVTGTISGTAISVTVPYGTQTV
jgi:hypothetical protein